MKNKIFYNFRDKKLIAKDIDFNMHDKQAWRSIEEKPSRKNDCYFLGEMSLEDCGKFEDYVRDKERIGIRDEPLPAMPILLKYFEEWKEKFLAKK
jgi:hypothetical protein